MPSRRHSSRRFFYAIHILGNISLIKLNRCERNESVMLRMITRNTAQAMSQVQLLKAFSLAGFIGIVLSILVALIFFARGFGILIASNPADLSFTPVQLIEFQQELADEERFLAEDSSPQQDDNTGYSDGVDGLPAKVTVLYDSIEAAINSYALKTGQPEVDGIALEHYFLTELALFSDEHYLRFLENLDAELVAMHANLGTLVEDSPSTTEETLTWHEFVDWFTLKHASQQAAAMAKRTEREVQLEEQRQQSSRFWLGALIALAFAVLFAQVLLLLRLQSAGKN